MSEIQCYCELCCSEGHCSCVDCNEPCTCVDDGMDTCVICHGEVYVSVQECPHCGVKAKDVKFCPRCGGYYADFPALSRVDNETSICSPCGTEEAIQDFTGEPLSPLVKEEC